jgi:hypothetical protein
MTCRAHDQGFRTAPASLADKTTAGFGPAAIIFYKYLKLSGRRTGIYPPGVIDSFSEANGQPALYAHKHISFLSFSIV